MKFIRPLIFIFILAFYKIAIGEEITFQTSPIESNISTLKAALQHKDWEKTSLPFFQLNSKTHFIKFIVKPSSSERILKIENPVLDTLEIFIFQEGKSDSLVAHYQDGKTFPFSKEEYSTNVNPNFIIPQSDTKLNIYIKSQSTSQTSVPIKIFKVEEYVETVGQTNLFAGLYFGILIVMLLYNLFIWSSVKDITYLYYCLYILALIFTQLVLQGYAKKFFAPNSAYFNLHSIVFSGSILGVATIIFARSFLKSKVHVPKLDKGLLIIIPLCIISLIMDLMGFYNSAFNFINLVIGLGSLYLFIASVFVYNKGYKPALFFVIAFAVFLLGTIIFVAKDYGQLPYNNFTIYGYQFGSVIQVILLSLALANSINILKKEKEEEQAAKLSALEENKRIIINQNQILETKVTEKTKELVEANDGLNKAMDDLKSTQVSLVESEKMASLGQLTAGVAHEINNPINFVSSNVKPLMRDFEDINSFISTLLEKAKNGEKITAENINELHSELDIEYTQKEISDLLAGIQEGADRTAEIVKGLKNFSRLDESDFKTADIEEGLDSTLILLRSNMRGEVELEKEYAKIPPIDCYAGKLNQVFMNLINNSVYAILNNPNKEIGKKGTLRLATVNEEENVQVIIEDNGMGMDKETINKLFNPFFTTKPVGEGTGLGMSITYSIINELHKGNIDVESEVGKGTKIVLTLPKDLKK